MPRRSPPGSPPGDRMLPTSTPSLHPVCRAATGGNAATRHPGPVRNFCQMCRVEAVPRSFRREIPCFRSQARRYIPQRTSFGWLRPAGNGVWPARERRSGLPACPARSPSEFDSVRGDCLLVYTRSTYTNEMLWLKVPKKFCHWMEPGHLRCPDSAR